MHLNTPPHHAHKDDYASPHGFDAIDRRKFIVDSTMWATGMALTTVGLAHADETKTPASKDHLGEMPPQISSKELVEMLPRRMTIADVDTVLANGLLIHLCQIISLI